MNATLDRLAARHRSGRGSALARDAFARAYQRPALRAALRALFPRSEPSGVVFVVGCYNSGTTLVRDLLRIHPSTCGPPVEGDLLTSELGTLEEGGYPRGLYANADTVVAAARRRRVDRATLLSDWRPWIEDGAVLVEKSVSNSVRISALAEAFPEARFVWVVRDPFEVAEGIRRRSRPVAGGEYSTEFLLRQWLFFDTTIEADRDPDRTLLVAYGRLIADPAAVAGRVFAFAGLPEVAVERHDAGLRVGDRVLAIRGDRELPEGTAATDRARWTRAANAVLEAPRPDRPTADGMRG